MAKYLVFVAAMMVVFLGLAQATRFTITTTVDEEIDQGQSQQRCQRQVQQQIQRIRSCQRYLSSRAQQQQQVIEEFGVGQSGQQQEQQQLNQCCNALQNLPEQCRCEAVRTAVRIHQQQGQQGQQGQQVLEQVRRLASFLPQQCNVGPQQCQV